MNPTNGLSVLMPVRNAERTLAVAVRSTLIAMPRNDSELLVLLDDSQDNSESLLREIRDPRLKILSSATNLGVAQSLNLLVEQSKYQILGRMDADDIALPWRFSSRLMSLALGDCFVFSAAAIYFEERFPIPIPQPPRLTSNKELISYLVKGNPFVHSTFIGKRSLVTDLGGYPSVPNEDYALWLKAAINNVKFFKSAIPSVIYRKHSKQITQSETWTSHLESCSYTNELSASLAIKIERLN